jgi:NADPH:quinone reductase-like Zn-dependent oxidoreductase
MLKDVIGVDGVVNTTAHAQDWQDAIKQHTVGRGADLIFDFMGAASFQQNLECAAVDGTIVTLGALGGVKLAEGTNVGNFIKKRLKYQGSTLRTRDVAYQSVIRQMFERVVMPRVDSGEFDARVQKVVGWDEIADAHTWLEQNRSSGKVVCLVS